MIVNCTSPSVTVSGECLLMITRTASGWRLSHQRTHSASPTSHWRHDGYSWRQMSLLLYVSTAQLTVNCVTFHCRSTCSGCVTQLKQLVRRLSSVTEARHRTCLSSRWVNCYLSQLIYCSINSLEFILVLQLWIAVNSFSSFIRCRVTCRKCCRKIITL